MTKDIEPIKETNCILCFGKGFIPAEVFGLPRRKEPIEVVKEGGGLVITTTEYGIYCPLCNRHDMTDSHMILLIQELINASKGKVAHIKRLTEKIRKLEKYIEVIKAKVKNLNDNL